ncbi:biotin-dependent carboxyltransferase family protein [Tamlana sp. s12]|uniref:5-oxoprolinase subunit C family protein n=1 Tax=Tamlana sp. s12 TaxID=1630406 RepID=UPI0008008BB9|nr:biotin-dependent carboxyltransferase family protein [Tamlana sp. s12]OBQ55295.1 allophanate hydrolase [Tamlana sp. s12]QQY81032.1 biotin-dependent carboxyltransferase family protein [Tamlana sp. s12]
MIKVLNSGLYSSIQDLGRYGFQKYGVPYSGAMDKQAMLFANTILVNAEDSAVLEMTMLGAKLEFQCDTFICISGADMRAKLNGTRIPNYKMIAVKAADVLSFSSAIGGIRTYLAVKGGFKTDVVMRSRSMYQGVTHSHVIQDDDLLAIEPQSDQSYPKNARLKISKDDFLQSQLGVFKGPEFDLLSEAQQKLLIGKPFTISKNNNRMAYQLEEPIVNTLEPIITGPVLPGTVQLTPSGNLIILMRDCQTTGGYPRVLQLNQESLNCLAQKYASQIIVFAL